MVFLGFSVVKNWKAYRTKKKSMKREVGNDSDFERRPSNEMEKLPGQVLDLSENSESIKDSKESELDHKPFSLGGSKMQADNAEEIESLEDPTRGSELQNYVENMPSSNPRAQKVGIVASIKVATRESMSKKFIEEPVKGNDSSNTKSYESDNSVEGENEAEDSENQDEKSNYDSHCSEEDYEEAKSSKNDLTSMPKKNLEIEVIEYKENEYREG
mmetsp:Transcript_9683/g.9489  ORF Transcript_9683/g.9489 Transcript_9683/m.9489 type:complete len:215 (-) Transcript_9683:2-646(-)